MPDIKTIADKADIIIKETGGRVPVSVQLMVHELRLMVHG